MKTRRDLLKLAAAAPAAATLPAVALASPADPIFALIAEHRRTLAEGTAASDRGYAIWLAYGCDDTDETLPQRQRCLDDPQHQRLCDLADEFFDRCGDIHAEIAETPATTGAGAMAKLREAVRLMLDGVEFESLDLEKQLVVTALADLDRLGVG